MSRQRPHSHEERRSGASLFMRRRGNTDSVAFNDRESENGMSHAGNTQVTFIFTARPEQVEEGDRLFASHAAFMEKTHYREGELALLRYNVVKGPELSNSLDPGSAPTDNTCFVLTEVYENPAGLDDHWKQGAESWQDFQAFVTWASDVDTTVLHGSPVIHSLW